ncbi:hypothetical protein CDL15_Pgr019185 [Punica granatum]|uniref:1-phosphatidylinositol-3-phosphate 5-kinase n=1 Tax=Punica granatum TaxID=22663 RepID=A0A218W495_PUNGR|nr:hypothetical protein CDL15_Pgr019185 [Punica granatum]
MCAMCHSCGSVLVKLENGEKVTHDRSVLKLDGGTSLFSCKVCGETQLSPQMTPMISPTSSLSSSDSSVSSSSEFSVDVNSYYRNNQEEHSVSSSHGDSNWSCVNGQLDSNLMYNRREDSNHNPDIDRRNFEKNGEFVEEVADNSRYFNDGMGGLMWDPPEPEDVEDDVEGSMTYDDDDDEGCGDGMNWGKPSSLSTSTDEGSGSYWFKEQKQRALQEVVNGKFRALVTQLLRSIGIASSTEDGESWVDIITSLSWEAASFLRPDAVDGKGMGLDGHVKVKCIATGTRSQSQVIRGLVFKKHAAHKHMPTKYKNPKLLLLRGVLGQSSNGLSSFDTMKHEADRLKSVIEMIEMCHPNVILVEKSVSRDVQESILAKGMTLVFDMKLHRLERIALCTGSPIVSTETFTVQKLKQCDSFYIEKFVEEHAGPSEGGKKPTKTLMFLEGCPTRLGCTILLKGSPSDELKKIKSVVRCSVLMAYHLILETSFLVDQRSMFSTLFFPGTANSPKDLKARTSKSIDLTPLNGFEEESSTMDIPISNGFHDEVSHQPNSDSPSSHEPYNPIIFSGFSSLSASLKKVIGDSFPLASTYPSLSAYFGINKSEPNAHILDAANSEEAVTSEIEISDSNDESNLEAVASTEAPDTVRPEDDHVNEDTGSRNEVNSVLDCQSILVLMSRRNAIRGTVCEQSHFSRITFYRNFDVPLGKFLRDNILNQKTQCQSCGELPEAHFYYYAHHNKQLTIQVKRLPGGKRLAGEGQGKIWMWGRCGKCGPGNGTLKSTKRVLVSTAARGLSFGKFLELSFSHHSSSVGLSSCGHSFQRDFLYFYGLGPMAAMFRYSPVTTYTVSMPPQMLDFNNPVRPKLLVRESDNVYSKGMLLFSEVGESLDKIRSKFEGSTPRPGMQFSDIEEMLKQERDEFEFSLQNTMRNVTQGKAVHKLLHLNQLLWEIVLESTIWDQRINSLLYSDLTSTSMSMRSAEEQSNWGHRENDGDSCTIDVPIKEGPIEDHAQEDVNRSLNEVPIEDQRREEQDDSSSTSTVADNIESQELVSRAVSPDLHHSESSVSLGLLKRLASQSSLLRTLKGLNGWFWRPFSEIRQIYLEEIWGGYSSRIEPLSGKTSEYLPRVHQLISEEGARLHIPLENGNNYNYIVSDYEGEISSIIACALALLKDQPPELEVATDEMQNLVRVPSTTSTSSESELVNSSFSDESRLSSFDGLVLLDSLLASEKCKAEVSLGVTKSMTKGKYSVVCLYADQFRDLRSRCCPSEVDFIASLARCRNWDAKGGKSKSVFAKTLDDRFIIKEIKKTEFESFEKFAPQYFKHMMQCFEIGNQTCLAKVLGIYQVTIRQPKSGKEVRHDLMVMENLTCGRNITRQYDLKGALHDRFNSATDGTGDVLLDQNFVNDMNSSPLYISNKAKHFLQRAVWNDTSFLNLINVMDYSLLVGVDIQKRELVCGIIDYLRQYTWDKQLETWVKTSLYVPKNVLPTVISPREYKKRFRKFMSTNFLCVPDNWCSSSCEICAPADDGSSNSRNLKIKEV